MRVMLISAVCVLFVAGASAQSKKLEPATGAPAKALEAKVRKAWEDYKNKNKAGFAAILADGFREVEEDGNGFGDKKAILEAIDQFELSQYTLKDFAVKPLAADRCVVYRRLYTAGDWPVDLSEFYATQTRVNEEDRLVIESQRPWELVTDLDAELQAYVDRPTVAFRRWLTGRNIYFL